MPADYEQDRVLVTCASGKQGTDLIPQLYGKWKKLRLQVVSDSSKEQLRKQYPNAEVVQADLAMVQDCKRILEGVTACYFVGPSFHPHETRCGYNIVDAAIAQRSAGGPFQHMVYSSVLFPILRKLLNHDCKRYIEEYLVESGVPYTVLQPTHLNETFPIAKVLNDEKPVYPAAWNPDVKFSFCTTKDLGEASARVLEQREKHYWATYQLVSTPEPLSYTEVCKIVSKVIGKEIEVKPKAFEDAVSTMLSMVVGNLPHGGEQATKEIGARMLLYYNDRGLVGNNNVTEMLLGHKTMTYEEWAKAKVEELKKQ